MIETAAPVSDSPSEMDWSRQLAVAGSHAIWRAVEDGDETWIVVLDSTRHVVFANAQVEKIWGALIKPLIGAEFSRILASEVWDERSGVIDAVLRTGHTITLHGFLFGCHRETAYIRVGTAEAPHVLVICRPIPVAARRIGVPAKLQDHGALATLTNREREVLGLIGDGLATADIAKALGRSVKTIEWHRVSLGNKLGVTNRVELARIAIAAGLSNLPRYLPAGSPIIATSITSPARRARRSADDE